MTMSNFNFDWNLDFPAKKRLVDALIDCATVSIFSSRMAVLSQLPTEVTSRIPQDPHLHIYMVGMIEVCLNFGAMDKLLDIVRYYEGDSDKRRRLDRVVRWLTFSEMILSKEQIDALDSILDSVKLPWPPKTLRDCYHLSARLGSLTPLLEEHDTAELLDNMLRALVDMGKQPDDDSFPILDFIERLAANAHPSPLADKLRMWVDTTCVALGSDAEALRKKIATPITPPKKLVPYLLVVLKPENENESASQFEIRAWIWLSRENSIPLICDKAKQSFTINAGIQALPGVIEILLEESFYTLNGNTKDLVIEIFVPHELLTRKANDWPIHSERMPLPLRHIDGINADNWPIKAGIQLLTNLGRKHQITVRSYDRTYRFLSQLWPSWKDKWDQFQAFVNIPYDEPIAWLCRTDEDDLRDFHEKLARTNVIGAVSLFAPSTVPQIENQNIILAILNASLPIAFWVRCKISNAEQDCRALLVAEQLADLPKWLWKRRKSGQSDLWNQVTLLWDDPDRLPPDCDFTNQLARPYQVGG